MLMKEKKDRSQGDMAKAFMGLNQMAAQMMQENPMNNYMQS